jgi:uridine kinase
MITSFDDIVTHIKCVTQRPYLIGIDGRSGAGKSVLADRLRDHLPDLVIIHKDDFYRVMPESARAALNAEQGYRQYVDWNRLERQVLCPLSGGEHARYERYDWVRKELAETIEVSPLQIVVVEGVGSTRPELRDYYHFRIWVETSDATRVTRQLSRTWDSLDWIRRWAAAEEFYVNNFRPQLTAHAVVAGE